jgi:glycosyltransferase involved in cell wall biosynthesis
VIVHFAGEGTQLSSVSEIASGNSRVKVHGFVRELAPLLHQMFTAISFSPSEGFPNFMLQAMSSGLPVLAFDNAATRELIQSNGRVGLLFHSAEEALHSVNELMKDSQRAIEMGKAASNLVQSSFSSGRMIDQTYQLYKEILS